MADRHDLLVEPSGDEATDLAARVRRALEESARLKQEIARTQAEAITATAGVIYQTLLRGRKLLLCGNGGSAADAQHLAAELLVRLRPHIDRQALPAIALAMDTSSLTACGNDYDFKLYYERMVEALGHAGDVLIGITTSGNSENIVRALAAARRKGLTTIGLLGGDGGRALAHCDHALVVPSPTTARIQEAHITIGHALMELVEDLWIAQPASKYANTSA